MQYSWKLPRIDEDIESQESEDDEDDENFWSPCMNTEMSTVMRLLEESKSIDEIQEETEENMMDLESNGSIDAMYQTFMKTDVFEDDELQDTSNRRSISSDEESTGKLQNDESIDAMYKTFMNTNIFEDDELQDTNNKEYTSSDEDSISDLLTTYMDSKYNKPQGTNK